MKPDERDRVAKYYDNSLEYLKQENHRHDLVKVSLGKMVNPGDTILDMGCGTGITSKFMGQLGANVTAVDISPKLIAYAQKQYKQRNVKYYVGDITSMTLKGKTYDGIVLVDVFEHIDPKYTDAVLNTIVRLSGENTWVFLNIPDARYQRAAREHIADRLQVIDNALPLTELIEGFETAGFEITSLDIYGIDAPCQYNTIVFRRAEILTDAYEKLMCPGELKS